MIESIEEAVEAYKDKLHMTVEHYEAIPATDIKFMLGSSESKRYLARNVLSVLDQMKSFLKLSVKEVEEIEKEVFKGSLPVKRIYEELDY